MIKPPNINTTWWLYIKLKSWNTLVKYSRYISSFPGLRFVPVLVAKSVLISWNSWSGSMKFFLAADEPWTYLSSQISDPPYKMQIDKQWGSDMGAWAGRGGILLCDRLLECSLNLKLGRMNAQFSKIWQHPQSWPRCGLAHFAFSRVWCVTKRRNATSKGVEVVVVQVELPNTQTYTECVT